MPTYVYETIEPDDADGERFEVFQRLDEPALTSHPESGRPVRRVICAPTIAGPFSETATRSRMSEGNLTRQGFTKYQNVGGGKYERVFGSGPATVSRDDD